MRNTSGSVLPIPENAFFEQAVFDQERSQGLLELARLSLELLDLVRGRLTRRVAGEPFLARLQELLRPTVVEVLIDPFLPAQCGSSLQRNDAGVWLCEYPGLSFQRCPVRACSLVSSLLLNGATMSQESSLTQSAHSVRQVLTAYTSLCPRQFLRFCQLRCRQQLRLLELLAAHHHGPRHACDFVSKCNRSDFDRPTIHQAHQPEPLRAVLARIADDGHRTGDEQPAQMSIALL